MKGNAVDLDRREVLVLEPRIDLRQLESFAFQRNILVPWIKAYPNHSA